MRIAYRVLAFVVAAEVAIQSVVMVWAVAGLGKWIQSGGVADAALMESGGTPFPEVFGFLVLFAAALYAGLRIGKAASTREPAPVERVATPV